MNSDTSKYEMSVCRDCANCSGVSCVVDAGRKVQLKIKCMAFGSIDPKVSCSAFVKTGD